MTRQLRMIPAALAALAAFFSISVPARADISLLTPPELMIAVTAGDLLKARERLVRGDKADTADIHGVTPLINAVKAGNTDMVTLLLEFGAHPGVTDTEGNTALHWAADRGDPVLIKLMLAGKAKIIDRENRQGLTPLMMATRAGRIEAIDVLAKAGADLGKSDYTGRDALAWAAESRNPEVAAALRRAGAH
ncbi:MAG: ankyrin repeat domain-containing protein [Rhodospirillaceae bacterium]